MKLGKCQRCGAIGPVKWEERHETYCKHCLRWGILKPLELIPKKPIDPEEVAVLEEWFKDWKMSKEEEAYWTKHDAD